MVTDAALDVRDGFELALVPEHTTRQSCEVVWRRGKTYGVNSCPERATRPVRRVCGRLAAIALISPRVSTGFNWRAQNSNTALTLGIF